MSGVVCSLFFFEDATFITPASTPSAANGSVSVSTLHPADETAKYKLNSDFAYASGGQLSGTFTGLVPGTYVVYARTSETCLKTLQVVVGYVLTYTPRYRLQHGTEIENTLNFKFDIEDRDYAGEVEFVVGGMVPEEIRSANEGGEDIFLTVIGGDCVIGLNSPTDGYFDVLNTYDERRFRGTLYLNDELAWRGFLKPMNNSEPYCQDRKFDVFFYFSDGLADLEAIPFSDNSENAPQVRISIMAALIFCLNKTGLQLDIWDAVNIYETTMAHGTLDSTLSQCCFDPLLYKQDDGTMESCLAVLDGVLKSIGARVYQSRGVWMVDNPTLKTGSTTHTRKFTYNGGSISGGDESYRIMLRKGSAPAPKITFRDREAIKSNIQMYGDISIIYSLGIEEKNNILINGDFEDEDIENGQLNSWQIELLDFFARPVPTIIDLKDEDRKKVLRIDYPIDRGITEPNGVIITSTSIRLFPKEVYRLRVSFDIFMVQAMAGDFSYGIADYSISIDTGVDVWFIQPTLLTIQGTNAITTSTTDLIDDEYLRSYVDDDNNWKTITFDCLIDSAIIGGGSTLATLGGDLQFKFRLTGSRVWDHVDIASLKAEDTFSAGAHSTRTYNNRRRVLDTVEGLDYIRCYRLEAGTEDQDYPEIITPNDNLTLVWKLQSTVLSPIGIPLLQQSWIKTIMVDNVQVQYLPDGVPPEETERVDVTINQNITTDLPVIVRHGDLPLDDNLRNITRGWFSLPDGTPTALWTHRVSDDSSATVSKLIYKLQAMYLGHYSVQRWKLSGPVLCHEVLPFPGNTVYEVRTGRIYLFTALTLQPHQAMATIEIVEALLGEPQIDEGTPDPDVEPPVNTREHTHEFTDEFA